MNEKVKAAVVIDSSSLMLDLFYDVTEESLDTPFGHTTLVSGNIGSATVTLIFRLGKTAKLNPLLVNYRAYIWALAARRMDVMVSLVTSQICSTQLSLATPLLFSDIFYPDNRLPDGQGCTMFSLPGDPKRGNYIFDKPFAPSARNLAAGSIKKCGYDYYEGIVGYAPALRASSRPEAAYYAMLGLTGLCATGVPEIILAGEMEIPSVLVGFGVNYINGLTDTVVPFAAMSSNIELANRFFSDFLNDYFEDLRKEQIRFDGGCMYRQHQEIV